MKNFFLVHFVFPCFVERMSIFHFENSLRCNAHAHGSSCAVDSLLELYYYGIFKFKGPLKGGSLVHLLNDISLLRQSMHQKPDCVWREPVWDWLVAKHGHAFAPKGRGDAEFLVGLRELCRQSDTFEMSFMCNTLCSICKLTGDTFSHINMLSITSKSNKLGNGFLKNVAPKQLEAYCRSQLPICCKQKRNAIEGSLTLPEFLVLELNIVDAHNIYEPPLEIEDQFTLWDSAYDLVSSVVVEPGHFLK